MKNRLFFHSKIVASENLTQHIQ